MFRAIANVFRVAELRARLAYTLALLAVYRLGVFINTPGVDRVAMNAYMAEAFNARNWRDLIKPRRMEIDQESLSQTYGKFVAEPLERGFGTTLGNSLRRVLLSSLQGAAITSVKIESVEHEFTTVPEVTEDVTDIVLNLKEVLLRMHTNEQKTLRIEVEGPKEVKAGDIIADDQVEILNPEVHIATLEKKTKLEMYMAVHPDTYPGTGCACC